MKAVRLSDNTYLFEKDEQELNMDMIGEQLVQKDLKIFELEMSNQLLGTQMINLELLVLTGGMENE